MATTLGIGYILQRRYVSMNALLLAALIILAFDPLQLFNVGFQLSFASVAAILLFTPLLNPCESATTAASITSRRLS